MSDRLYRGISKETGEWVYGYYYKMPVVFPNESTAWMHYIVCLNEVVHPPLTQAILIDPATLGQGTGLKDAKNREIYGGDIVKSDNDGVGIYEIIWLELWAGYFRKVIQPSNYEPNGSEIQPLPMAEQDLEIIGNRHQHKELLEADNG